MESENDVVMKQWINEYPDLIVKNRNKIPLSYQEFIDGLIENPNVTFNFCSRHGSFNLLIAVKEGNVDIIIHPNYKVDKRQNKDQGINLQRTIKIDDNLMNELNNPIDFHHFRSQPAPVFVIYHINPRLQITTLCDPTLKPGYLLDINKQWDNTLDEWGNYIVSLLPFNDKILEADKPRKITPKNISQSGEKFYVNYFISYADLSENEIMNIFKIRNSVPLPKIKHYPLIYYVVNILSISIFHVKITGKITRIYMKVESELIKSEDYAATFSVYKKACETNNIELLAKLANDLKIENYSKDELCEHINSLQWSDF